MWKIMKVITIFIVKTSTGIYIKLQNIMGKGTFSLVDYSIFVMKMSENKWIIPKIWKLS